MENDAEQLLRKDFKRFRNLLRARYTSARRQSGERFLMENDDQYRVYQDIDRFAALYPHKFRELTRLPMLDRLESRLMEIKTDKTMSACNSTRDEKWRSNLDADFWNPDDGDLE